MQGKSDYFRILGLVSLLIMLAISPGCSGSNDKGSVEKATNACAQLSKEQVSKILGEEFGDPKEEVRKNNKGEVVMSSCTFSPSGKTSLTSLNVLSVPRKDIANPHAALKEHFRSLQENLGDKSYSWETLEGVGQAAGYDPQMGQMTIFNQGYMLILSLRGRPQEKTKELLVKLGRTALSP